MITNKHGMKVIHECEYTTTFYHEKLYVYKEKNTRNDEIIQGDE